jgi:hypothetical protein
MAMADAPSLRTESGSGMYDSGPEWNKPLDSHLAHAGMTN